MRFITNILKSRTTIKFAIYFTLSICFPTALLAQNELSFGNHNYKKSILSSYYENANLTDNLPVLALNSNQQLIVHFDEAAEDPANYNFTVVHCEEDWTASDIFESEYLEGLNEEIITDYKYSKNTDINYIHYRFNLPGKEMKIKRSGNYALLVYEDFDKSKLVFTKQFYVVDSKLRLDINAGIANETNKRESHHQFNGTVDISDLNTQNPNKELSFRLVKNNDYKRDYIHLEPNYMSNTKAEFNNFLNTMPAGNEFRIFDIRLFNQGTNNVHQIIRKNGIRNVILVPGKVRNNRSYTNYLDHNGKMFMIGERWQSNRYETDYAMVHFYLDVEAPLENGSLYVFGELTGWEYTKEAKMKYNEKSKQYVGRILLKQGLYDYAFIFVPNDEKNPQANWGAIEGNFSESNNDYLLLVYWKPPQNNYQKLIGIKRFRYFE